MNQLEADAINGVISMSGLTIVVSRFVGIVAVLILLSACAAHPERKTVFPKNWHHGIADGYIGELRSGSVERKSITHFDVGPDGLVSGAYNFRNDNGLEHGKLNDCHANVSGQLTCQWQDRYGEGTVVFDFDLQLKSFKGLWGFEKPNPKYFWNGSRVIS